MRCQDGSYYNDRDQLESWGRSGSATALIPENSVRSISSLGYGLFFDGRRFITVDSGYSTWSSSPSITSVCLEVAGTNILSIAWTLAPVVRLEVETILISFFFAPMMPFSDGYLGVLSPD